MSMLLNFVKSFAREEEGQDLLEYALLVALIALVAIGAVGAAGGACPRSSRTSPVSSAARRNFACFGTEAGAARRPLFFRPDRVRIGSSEEHSPCRRSPSLR